MAGERASAATGWPTPQEMQLTVHQFSSLAIKKGDKKVKEPTFSSPSQMVTFVIGVRERKEVFLVHKEHACKYSPVLDKAFNGGFKEARTQKYEMKDTTPDVFRVFVQWLYSQKVTHIHHDDDGQWRDDMTAEEKQEHENICDRQTTIQIQLWVLAERLLIPRLQNELMDVFGLVGLSCFTPFEYRIEYIYQHTADDSPLRRFVVKMSAWSRDSNEYKTYRNLYPYEFLLDLATEFSAAAPWHVKANHKRKIQTSHYHVEDNA